MCFQCNLSIDQLLSHIKAWMQFKTKVGWMFFLTWMVQTLGGTSHMRLCDHCILRSLVGRKDQDHPSSLHTIRWKPKGPKNLSWMTSPHGFLHDKLGIMFPGPPNFASSPPPRGKPDATSNTMSMVWPLDENQGPSRVHGHNPWLVWKWPLVGHSSSSQTNDKA